jgi:hypothetical protein
VAAALESALDGRRESVDNVDANTGNMMPQ